MVIPSTRLSHLPAIPTGVVDRWLEARILATKLFTDTNRQRNGALLAVVFVVVAGPLGRGGACGESVSVGARCSRRRYRWWLTDRRGLQREVPVVRSVIRKDLLTFLYHLRHAKMDNA